MICHKYSTLIEITDRPSRQIEMDMDKNQLEHLMQIEQIGYGAGEVGFTDDDPDLKYLIKKIKEDRRYFVIRCCLERPYQSKNPFSNRTTILYENALIYVLSNSLDNGYRKLNQMIESKLSLNPNYYKVIT